PLHSLPIIPKHPSLIPYHPQSSSTPWKHGWKKKTHRIEDSSPCSSFQDYKENNHWWSQDEPHSTLPDDHYIGHNACCH
ncbi:hypothetical protein LINPERPRIM_LOCUS35190, partial [Linum perenne]